MTTKIFIAFTSSQNYALGSAWEITARPSGFYLESFDRGRSVAHASLHGPTDTKTSYRFHLRVDRDAAERRAKDDAYIASVVPKRGCEFVGRQVGPDAYLVARIRWTWELDRDKFRAYACCGDVPERSSPL